MHCHQQEPMAPFPGYCDEAMVAVPILQIRKLNPRVIRLLAQRPRTGKMQPGIILVHLFCKHFFQCLKQGPGIKAPFYTPGIYPPLLSTSVMRDHTTVARPGTRRSCQVSVTLIPTTHDTQESLSYTSPGGAYAISDPSWVVCHTSTSQPGG